MTLFTEENKKNTEGRAGGNGHGRSVQTQEIKDSCGQSSWIRRTLFRGEDPANDRIWASLGFSWWLSQGIG